MTGCCRCRRARRLLNRYGEPIRHFIEKRLGMLAAAAASVLIVGYVGYRAVTHQSPELTARPAASSTMHN